MLQTPRVLRRKDASSLIVAISIALCVNNPLMQFGMLFASKLTNLSEGYYAGVGQDWRGEYLHPIVTLAVQLVMIELALQIFRVVSKDTKKK